MPAASLIPTGATTLAVRALQGDTVDLLCQRHLGRTAAATEATLAANPGIAATAHLQPGQPVTLVRPAQQARHLIQLWD